MFPLRLRGKSFPEARVRGATSAGVLGGLELIA